MVRDIVPINYYPGNTTQKSSVNCILKSREWDEVIVKWQKALQMRASCAQAVHLAPHSGQWERERGVLGIWTIPEPTGNTSLLPGRSWSRNAVTLAVLETLCGPVLQRDSEGALKTFASFKNSMYFLNCLNLFYDFTVTPSSKHLQNKGREQGKVGLFFLSS